MQPDQPAYTVYVPESYNSQRGFTFWIDKNKFHSEIDADNVLLTHSFGALTVKRKCDIFETEAEAKKYIASILEGRLSTIQKQIHDLRQEEVCA